MKKQPSSKQMMDDIHMIMDLDADDEATTTSSHSVSSPNARSSSTRSTTQSRLVFSGPPASDHAASASQFGSSVSLIASPVQVLPSGTGGGAGSIRRDSANSSLNDSKRRASLPAAPPPTDDASMSPTAAALNSLLQRSTAGVSAHLLTAKEEEQGPRRGRRRSSIMRADQMPQQPGVVTLGSNGVALPPPPPSAEVDDGEEHPPLLLLPIVTLLARKPSTGNVEDLLGVDKATPSASTNKSDVTSSSSATGGSQQTSHIKHFHSFRKERPQVVVISADDQLTTHVATENEEQELASSGHHLSPRRSDADKGKAASPAASTLASSNRGNEGGECANPSASNFSLAPSTGASSSTGGVASAGKSGASKTLQEAPAHAPSIVVNRTFIDLEEKAENACRERAQRLLVFVWKSLVSTPPLVTESSLKLFSRSNPIRLFCLWLLGLPAYNGFVYLVALFNVLLLLLDQAQNTAEFDAFIQIADYCFAAFFCVEFVIKIIALGGYWPAKASYVIDDATKLNLGLSTPAYFRDLWNCLDAFVTLTSVLALVVPFLRIFRAIRSVRLIVRIEGLRIILMSLIEAFPEALNALILSSVFFLVFGILGVQLMKGKMYYCNDLSITKKVNCVGDFNMSTAGPVLSYTTLTPRRWVRSQFHFDHLGAALLSVFVVAVSDGWSKIMFQGMDTVDDQTAMLQNNTPYLAFFFVSVFFVCSFFSLNMTVGTLVNFFSEKKSINDGTVFLTEGQRNWLLANEALEEAVSSNEHEVPLDNNVSLKLHGFLNFAVFRMQTPVWDVFMFVIILVNCAATAAISDAMSVSTARAIDYVQLFCLIVFSIEVGLRMTAYGPLHYFVPAWNRFDFLVVVVGYVSIALPSVRPLSLLRIFRVLRLIRGTGVERLIQKVIRGALSLAYIILVLLMTYFIYAVAGVELFGKVKLNGVLTENSNFRSVFRGMLVLYQCGTTEAWTDVMAACSLQDDCTPGVDCGNSVAATIFFMMFMMTCTYIALQLFVAFVVEIFSDSMEDTKEFHTFQVSKERWIERFGTNNWAVHYREFVDLLPDLPRSITKLPQYSWTSLDLLKLIVELPIPVDSQRRVRFADCMYALAHQKYAVDPRSVVDSAVDSVVRYLQGTTFTLAQAYAIDSITRIYIKYAVQQEEELEAELLKRNEDPAVLAARPRSAWKNRFFETLVNRRRATMRKPPANTEHSSPASKTDPMAATKM